eukprot:2336080-Pyramimonas_sp.AAC.1
MSPLRGARLRMHAWSLRSEGDCTAWLLGQGDVCMRIHECKCMVTLSGQPSLGAPPTATCQPRASAGSAGDASSRQATWPVAVRRQLWAMGSSVR